MYLLSRTKNIVHLKHKLKSKYQSKVCNLKPFIIIFFSNKLFLSFSESGDLELHQDNDVGQDDTEGDNEAVI
jgi:hypothetical protein